MKFKIIDVEQGSGHTIFALFDGKAVLAKIETEGKLYIYGAVCPCCIDESQRAKIDKLAGKLIQEGRIQTVAWPTHAESVGDYSKLTPARYSAISEQECSALSKNKDLLKAVKDFIQAQRESGQGYFGEKYKEEIQEAKRQEQGVQLDILISSLVRQNRFADAYALCNATERKLRMYLRADARFELVVR